MKTRIELLRSNIKRMQERKKNKDCAKDIFYQGCIYTCEAILKKESK